MSCDSEGRAAAAFALAARAAAAISDDTLLHAACAGTMP